ncbi:VENN motif pre-toxin domain-containing protein [Gilliamella sp. App2-1]|uniref:VENN motif pre-toxin domain-containing protein n=1 Tax=Gilliamella sp. App2-1 TaxID=3120230 RepID=UPI00094D9CD0|nr:VENN motif pre-toxin domain-containing protein [Gilliamella apicola]
MVAELQGNSALVGGLGAAASERSADAIAGILYPDKDIKDLSQEERQQISALSQLATGLAIAAAGGDIQDINTGVAAGKNAVENNSLLGDRFREKHKNSVEYWKTEIREKIGENTASQILNGIMMSYGDMVDFGAGAADTALDAILALGSCTMGASYCDTALDDLGKANKTASDAMTSLINGDTWDHVRDVFAKAQKGEQRSLEEVASILTSILVPSKLAGNAGKVVNKIDDIVPPKTKAGKGASATGQVGNNLNINKLVNSANKPVNAQGLSEAARAWEKHAGRQGGTFEALKGYVTQKNAAASKFVKEVLENPNTIRTELSRGGVEYRLPNGQGIRYNADGSFSGFLDPKKK